MFTNLIIIFISTILLFALGMFFYKLGQYFALKKLKLDPIFIFDLNIKSLEQSYFAVTPKRGTEILFEDMISNENSWIKEVLISRNAFIFYAGYIVLCFISFLVLSTINLPSICFIFALIFTLLLSTINFIFLYVGNENYKQAKQLKGKYKDWLLLKNELSIPQILEFTVKQFMHKTELYRQITLKVKNFLIGLVKFILIFPISLIKGIFKFIRIRIVKPMKKKRYKKVKTIN